MIIFINNLILLYKIKFFFFILYVFKRFLKYKYCTIKFSLLKINLKYFNQLYNIYKKKCPHEETIVFNFLFIGFSSIRSSI